MDKLRNRISEEQLNTRLFTKTDFLYLMKDMSLRHVGISGMGHFTIDFSFSFVVRFLYSIFLNPTVSNYHDNCVISFPSLLRQHWHIFWSCLG